MPPGERSIKKVAMLRGVRYPAQDEKWSRDNRWVERAGAYDQYLATTAIEVRTTGIVEAQKQHLTDMTMAYHLSLKLGMQVLKKMYEKALEPLSEDDPDAGKVDTASFNRVVRTLSEIDTGMRRSLGLPTHYKIERVEEDLPDDEVYVVGAARHEDED